MPDSQQKTKPTITRRGNRVSMDAATYDDLITRLLVAEGEMERKNRRSWWKPGGGL